MVGVVFEFANIAPRALKRASIAKRLRSSMTASFICRRSPARLSLSARGVLTFKRFTSRKRTLPEGREKIRARTNMVHTMIQQYQSA